jgi:hypothetical protein
VSRGAADRIAALEEWRRGGAVAAVSSGAFVASGWLGAAASICALAVAAIIVAGAQIVLRSTVRRCALDSELAGIPAVARCRRRLCSARRRRMLASAVRHTAFRSQHAHESDLVLWERVRFVAPELVAMADELEAAQRVEPRTMVDVDSLLCDGRLSPLLNDQLPMGELACAVRSIRFRLQTARSSPDARPPKIGTSTHGGAPGIGVCSGRLAGHGPTKRRGLG